MKSVPKWCVRLALAALAALALSSPSPASRRVSASGAPAVLRGDLHGQVAEAGAPARGVAGARVVASDSWAGPLDTVTTDATGNFVFRSLPAGRVDLRATARDFAAPWQLTVAVRAGEAVSGARLKLARTAVLEGRVVDRQGRPVAAAEVTALDARCRSGRDGRYRLAGVRPEMLQVYAQSAVHVSTPSPELRIAPGETRRLPDLVLAPGRTVSGRVVGPGDRPLAGVRVNVTGRSAVTDARGGFRFGGVGRGWINAWLRGFEPASLSLPSDSADVTNLTLHLSRASENEPEMMLSMSRDTWAPGERVTATAWTCGAEQVRLRVTDSRGRLVHHGAQTVPRSAGNRALLAVPALPAGDYVLHASARGIEKSMPFRVSEVALLAEQWPGAARVRAVRLADGEPVAGLPLADAAGRALGTTDAGGLLDLPAAGDLIVMSADPRRPAAIQLSPRLAPPPAARLAVLTDRPALRPGGALGVKVIARSERDGTLMEVADSAVRVELKAEESDPVVREGRLDASGVHVDSLTVPGKLEFGQARLQVSVAGATEHRSLPLTVRPTPALTVQVTADPEIAMPGDTVRFLIRARREDGLPASGVRFTVDEQEWPSSYEWGEDRGFRGMAWLGLARREVLVADPRGEAVFTEVLPELMAGDMELHVTVVAQEPGSEEMGGSAAVQALSSSWHVSVPAVDDDGPGKPLSATFKLQALPRRVVANAPVHLDLYRLEVQKRTRRAVWLESAELTTGSDGEVRWQSRLWAVAGGQYRVRAVAADSLGRVAETEYVWWVPGATPEAEAEVTFELVAARDTLDETAAEASFRIRAGWAGVAHVAAAGREVLTWLPDVRFQPGVTEFAVPRGQFGAGGVRVAAYVSRGGDVLFGSATVVVRRAGARIGVELKPEKPLLAPRDTLRLVVTTRDATGAPVPAEVDLTAYDRGLLGFGPDENPDLMEAFWRPRMLTLQVRSSVRRGERAGGKDSADEVRRDFRDVAFWAPRLRTGADGTARVAFRVPDNVTTWRITGHAVGAGTSVGRGQADVTVRRPVVLQVSRPEALVAGDSVVLRALLRTAAGEPPRRFTDWRIDVRGGTWSGAVPDVEVSPAHPAEVLLPIRVNADAETLRVTVVARGGGLADGVERAIPVERAVRTVFGRGDEPGVAWDSTTVLRWQSPALAAVLRGGGFETWLPLDPGPERVARVGALENLERLGLWKQFMPQPGGGGGDEEGPAGGSGSTGVPAHQRHGPLAQERQRMFAALTAPRALLRADNSLDLERACEVLVAATAGRDSVERAVMDEIRALALRVKDAAAGRRVSAEDSAQAARARAAVALRFGPGVADFARLASSYQAFGYRLVAGDFSTRVETADLWARAHEIMTGPQVSSASPHPMLHALLGGRGRGWTAIWPAVVTSHLAASDLALPPLTGSTAAERREAVARPEVVTAASPPDIPGALRVTHHRGHAPLPVPADTSNGALTVRLYRDIPDTDAWGEPDTREEEVRGPVRVGETLRMLVRSTRPIECDELEAIVPLCGAFDTRPPVGAEESEGRRWWTMDRRLRGRIESPAWRPDRSGDVIWGAALRVTHAGRFTLLPPVLRSPVFPGLYRAAGGPITIEALP